MSSLPDRSPARGDAAKLLSIRVPATAANLGPGFDSVGLALSFYLDVDVYPAAKWRVEAGSPAVAHVPADESNLIVQTALDVARRHGTPLRPCHLVLTSDIPLARGLGSSASAIVAGVELANGVAGLGLRRKDKALLAARAEGHPDNAVPAIYGGVIVASTLEDGDISFVRGHLPPCDVVVSIPGYRVETWKARAALPGAITSHHAVAASSRANVLVAALFTGDWVRVGAMMRRDLFHEPYREPLMPDLRSMREVAYANGAYGASMSGAGPTLIAFAPPGEGARLRDKFAEAFPSFETRVTSEDGEGSRVAAGE